MGRGLTLVGLVLDYKLNGNSKSLAAAAQVARFILKPVSGRIRLFGLSRQRAWDLCRSFPR